MHEELWHIPHLNKVIRYHNDANGTSFELNSRCEEIYPELKADRRWDWICVDKKLNVKAAIEVKRLTSMSKHREYAILSRIARQVETTISEQLDGSFGLLLTTDDMHLSLQGSNAKQLELTLQKVILQSAHQLTKGQSLDLTDRLSEDLPCILPPDVTVELTKTSDNRSFLSFELATGGTGSSLQLEGQQMEHFRHLIRSASQQLLEAKSRGMHTTFLVLLDLLYFVAARPGVVQNSYCSLSLEDRSGIDFTYYLQNSVSQITC
jgi:hypothetical protein